MSEFFSPRSDPYLRGVGLSVVNLEREATAGLVRASKYMLLSSIITSASILWILAYLLTRLANILTSQDMLEEIQRTALYLTLNPQVQAAMLCMAAGFLVSLYATFAEFVPALRDLGVSAGGLSTAAGLISAGLILTVVFFAVPMVLLPILYGAGSYPYLGVVISALPLGGIVTYLISYVGFLLAFVRLGDLTGRTGFTVAGVLVLVSLFIQPLAPIAWLIALTTARRLL
ncbi:MAG: hypothetical protein QXS42_07610 [Zestosphaera sp.]